MTSSNNNDGDCGYVDGGNVDGGDRREMFVSGPSSVFDRPNEMDFVQKRYDRDVRFHLARRCVSKRELILRFIEDYMNDILNSDACRVTGGCQFVDRDVYDLLLRRRELRNVRGEQDDRKMISKIASRLNVEQLNLLLYNLDELYRDIVELIEMNEKSGLAIKTPLDQTFDILLQVIMNLLNDDDCG